MNKGQLVRASDAARVPDTIHDRPSNVVRWAQQNAPEDAVRYRALLRRHARPIILIMLGCLALSVVVTWLLPPVYVAKAIIEIQSMNQDFMNTKDIDPTTPGGTTMDSYLDTQTRLLSSQSLSDRVKSTLLADNKNYSNQSMSELSKLELKFGLKQPAKAAFERDLVKTLGQVKVKPEGQSSLLSITVSGPSSELTAKVANTIANQHIASQQEARWATASQTTEFLTAQVNALRTKLKQSEDDLEAYARRTGLIITGNMDHDTVGSDKLREVQADLEKAESDRAEKQAQMELINSSAPDALPKILDDGGLREAKSHLADLRRQLADLNSLYTPNHYKVQEVQSQIAAVEDQIKQEKLTILTRVRNDYRAALRRETLQREEYNRQLAQVTNDSSKEVAYNLLKRDVDANRDLYQSMLQKIKEANVVAAVHASNIRIVDRATAPTSPDQPNMLVDTSIGLLAGCMFSVLFVLIRERADGSIRTAGQSMRVLRLPELAIIPSAKGDIRTQIVSASKSSKQRLRLGQPSRTARPDMSKELVTSWRNTGSVVAESYRSAVASIILWGREQERAHKALVVTSAHSSAGKTTSVLNLGLGLVESGRRVLLIDGDLRLPRLGEIFGLETSTGLTNILAESLHPTVGKELIVETSLPGLHVLASGPRYMNVTELLHSDDLPKFLEVMREEYDFILIDSPPALPLTDARLIAQHADGVILVVRAGSTTVDQSVTVQQLFHQDGSHIFGTILNHWDARSEDPSFMTSYMKYAVAQGQTKVKLNVRKRSASAGD